MVEKQSNLLKKERHRWKVSIQISHPKIAVEAYNWNPADFTAGSRKTKEWKCQECNHIWEASISARTIHIGYGSRYCPDCPRILNGSVSLLESNPDIALEAYGWDPKFITSHNGQIKDWRCNACGHIWPTQVSHRTDLGSGCPKCYGMQVDSLKVTYPDIADEAEGWNAENYTSGSSTVLVWKCSKCKHLWEATPKQRVKSPLKWGCSRCNKNAGQVGTTPNGQNFRIPIQTKSLLFRFPTLANELVDPLMGSIISCGARAVVAWRCSICFNIWEASVHSRAIHKTDCPDCSKSGFNKKLPGYIYLLQANRKGNSTLQYGITNNLDNRLTYHKRNGFLAKPGSLFLECHSGSDTVLIENLIKKNLLSIDVPSIAKDPIVQDKFPGYTEAFLESRLQVDSLKSLLDILKISLPDTKVVWIEYRHKSS